MGKRANIAECKEIALRHDAQAVVIMRVGRDGEITVSTYGENRHKCEIIGEWAQRSIWSMICRIPFETVFGWRNKGKPKPLEMREYMSLTPPQKAYYQKCMPSFRQPDQAA